MGKLEDIHERLKTLEEETHTGKYDPNELNDKTRSKVAMTFVYGFFILTGGTLVITMIYNVLLAGLCQQEACLASLLNVKDILLAVIGYIGSPLGFIMGFYFKGKFEN